MLEPSLRRKQITFISPRSIVPLRNAFFLRYDNIIIYAVRALSLFSLSPHLFLVILRDLRPTLQVLCTYYAALRAISLVVCVLTLFARARERERDRLDFTERVCTISQNKKERKEENRKRCLLHKRGRKPGPAE